MDQRQAFLDAIIADPDDDTVRLVYADWLDENGDEADRDRARLIRLQIELERLDEDDDRRTVIRRECDGLIGRRGQEWTDGFSTSRLGISTKTDFKRGFLRAWYFDLETLSDPAVDALLAREPITYFRMFSHDADGDTVTEWKHLPRIRTLRPLSGWDRGMKALLRSPRLTGLRVLEGLAALNEEDVALVASEPRFASLWSLDISHNGLDDRAVAMVSQSRTLLNLTCLDLGDNQTTAAVLESLVAGPLSGQLRFLGLSRDGTSRVPPLGSRAAELLATFPCLQGIDLAGQHIGDEGAEILAASPLLKGLKRLELGWNGLGPRGVTALLSSPHLTAIEELDLSGNTLGGEWVATLGAGCPLRFRSLLLNGVALDGEAVALLADAPAIEGLRELALNENPISDRGAIALAGSVRLTRLRSLDLGNCQVGNEGALALAASPLLTRLKNRKGRFALGGNRYGEEADRLVRERFGDDLATDWHYWMGLAPAD